MVHADVYGSVAAHALRVPFVSTRHNDDRYLLGPFRHVDRFFSRPVRRIIAISDAVRVFLERAGYPREKLLTIHYGLDALPEEHAAVPPAGAGVAPGTPLVLAIGRLIEQKDHATLIRAFERLEHPDAHLAILGWGPLEGQTQALAGPNVHVLGRVEPRDWLTRADVFAHSSRWEGFGLVLLEAMLSSLPVVATRVSAVPEIVVDGTTGFLVPPRNDELLAARLGELLADADLRRRLGAAGLDRARTEFSVETMTTRTIDVYRAA
jgi:glycosyltransferase involved in cell wall biosynthesis